MSGIIDGVSITAFNVNGTKLFVENQGHVDEYNLTTPFDLTRRYNGKDYITHEEPPQKRKDHFNSERFVEGTVWDRKEELPVKSLMAALGFTGVIFAIAGLIKGRR